MLPTKEVESTLKRVLFKNFTTEVKMSHNFRVFLVCAFGGGIGTLVALQLNTYFWWLGLLVGGASGYFFYDFERIIKAVKSSLVKYNGQEKNRFFWELMDAFLGMINFIISFGVPLWLLYEVLPPEVLAGKKQGGSDFIAGAIGISIAIASIFSVFYTEYKIREKTSRDEKLATNNSCLTPAEIVRQSKEVLLKANPIFFLFYWYPKSALVLIGGITKLIYRIIRKVPAGINFLKKWIPILIENTISLFEAICTDRKFLCMLSAIVGASLGYFFDSVIKGALIGGTLGVFGYEFISRRWPSSS